MCQRENVYSTAIDFYFQFWFQHAFELGKKAGGGCSAPPVRGVYMVCHIDEAQDVYASEYTHIYY